MRISTTTTSKGQLTIPKVVRDKLGINTGTKVDIFPTQDGTAFIGKPQRKSRILEFAGDLKHLDKGEPLSEIRKKAQALAAEEIVKKWKKQKS